MQQAAINGFRLAPQQERLWSLLADGSNYRAQCALLIEGNLDANLLKAACQQLVDRHEILRTTFHRLPGMKLPVQVIAERGDLAWQEVDLTGRSPAEQDSALEALYREAGRSPFDFERGPLLRLALAALAPARHVLVITLPALCADAWTLKVLVQEIIGRAAGAAGEAEAGEPLQYLQFSEWQHELLEDEDAGAGRAYWRQQNLAAIPALRLPFERPAGGKTGFDPASRAVAFGGEVLARLDAAAGQHGVSAGVFLLACWQTLLWRLTGQPDIVVADRCDGRQHEMLHDALGLFARWLPVHGRFEAGFRFSEVLAQLDEAQRAAQEWQEYFVLDDSVIPGVNGQEPPFFAAGFEYEERPARWQANGVSFSVYRQHTYAERFDLHLHVVRAGDTLTAGFHYHPGRFGGDDVDRLAGYFETLLHSALESPAAAVDALEILSPADRDQILAGFNQTGADYPADKPVHRLFEEQVERTPDQPAVVFGEQRLSYAELNARANQLARHLQALGVGPETVVGLCLERSVEMIVGIVGILKAGGAYAPLDPMYPQERLAFTLADARAPVLLTQGALVSNLPQPEGHLICLDADWETIARQSDENLEAGVSADNLAYVIYTSGSTGRPKGVMVRHGAVVNLALALRDRVYGGPALRGPLKVSLNAPLTFDSSVKQWVQLLFGHTLHVVPEEARPDGQALLSFVERQALDVLDCTPAQLGLLLEATLAHRPAVAPKLTLVGGEAIREATWTALQRSTETSFVNVYGPTECTVDATASLVQEAPPEPVIGRPLANTRIYLLDRALKPVPLGVPGELHIGGAGLARGYLNRPDLTAEKFMPDPFSGEPGARLYKTGDMAAYLPDGNIKFLGRVDHQVKVRGFRIELGEIEAVLGQHPEVRETAVIVREDVPGDMRLVAYVVTNDRNGSAVGEMRAFLREKLPEYMVPSAFVTLDSLPLTRNGKVDRRALPVPESVRPELRAAYVAPRTQIEETIAAIWQDVLQVEKVGVNDNFFDLGGHSLLMVRVHTRLRQAFDDREISLIEMFRNPTVTMLARYFAEGQSERPSLEQAQDRAAKRKQARRRQSQTVAVRRQGQ